VEWTEERAEAPLSAAADPEQDNGNRIENLYQFATPIWMESSEEDVHL
jgi:hypothetical protein